MRSRDNNTTAIVRWHTNNNLNRGTVVYDDPWGKVPVNYKIDSQRTVNERSSYFGVFDTDNTTKKAILIENRLGSTSILQ
jgi:hypothetical protein